MVGLGEARYVRLLDVVGDGTNLDSAGNAIYDPYPMDNGFNAAGVGVISTLPSSVPEPTSMALVLLAGASIAVARRSRTAPGPGRWRRKPLPSPDRRIDP